MKMGGAAIGGDAALAGKRDGQDGGCIGEARHYGGVYFDTRDDAWTAVGHALDSSQVKALVWQVNEQLVRNPLENRVAKIEYVPPPRYSTVEKCCVVRLRTSREFVGTRRRAIVMDLVALNDYLKSILLAAGFQLAEICDDLSYGNRRAGAAFYSGTDCELQICWSVRDGGVNYMLAPPNAPRENGFINESRLWQLMLKLSKVHDDLKTPRPGAPLEEEMAWMKALFEIHIESARATLVTEMSSRG